MSSIVYDFSLSSDARQRTVYSFSFARNTSLTLPLSSLFQSVSQSVCVSG